MPPIDMNERVSRTVVAFLQPFFVEGLGHEQAPGTYEIETVEEPLGGLSFLAYRTVSTSILIPVAGREANAWQLVSIAADVVREALRQAERAECRARVRVE